ncbi:MAG TPA: helix-turn-helix transcriptional regulator [Propionibacteriaceae bacterium]|nr:helix-turn-helix transcriptional regulator [Propionibacteriaceae bacterium]
MTKTMMTTKEQLNRTSRVAASMSSEIKCGMATPAIQISFQCLTAKAIRQQLHIGERTVETHLTRVYAKFNVHTRYGLVRALTRTALDSDQ